MQMAEQIKKNKYMHKKQYRSLAAETVLPVNAKARNSSSWSLLIRIFPFIWISEQIRVQIRLVPPATL